jgi:N6-L-threonylcarbamoyladenine synthase
MSESQTQDPEANQLVKELPPARILGIETSCDETAAAVVENGRLTLSSVVASQVELHARYGGIFPEVASREHIRVIYPIIDQALQNAHLDLAEIDAIAVTRGPGLPGSLVVGVNAAKGLALGGKKPLVGVNHLEAHIYSAWITEQSVAGPAPGRAAGRPAEPPKFPLVALIVSGGHTELVLITDHLKYMRLGGTLDDAAGEAFDKVARLLGLNYPGGPHVQMAAVGGDDHAYEFPRAWLRDSWDFSFSGLKTAVLRMVRNLEAETSTGVLRMRTVADLAASFQQAVVEVLTVKTVKAVEAFGGKAILVAGGVSANQALRKAIQSKAPCPVHLPPLSLCTDNAAMVAAAGYFRFAFGQRDALDIDVLPTWPLDEV